MIRNNSMGYGSGGNILGARKLFEYSHTSRNCIWIGLALHDVIDISTRWFYQDINWSGVV